MEEYNKMDFGDIYKTDYLKWEDIEDWGAVERVGTILNEGEVRPTKYGKRAVILIQLKKTKEIKEYWLGTRDYSNISKEYGNDSINWVGKTVRFDPYVYSDDKTRIVLKPEKLFATEEDVVNLIKK